MRRIFKAASADGAAGEAMRGRIDRDYIRAQTAGDVTLARDLLRLFEEQLRQDVDAFPDLSALSLSGHAHRLKGGARALGFAALAELAQTVEARPSDPAALAALRAEMREILAELAGADALDG